MRQNVLKHGIFFLMLSLGLFFLSNNFVSKAQTKFELDGNMLKLPKAIIFETSGDKIKPESEEALKHVKEYLEAKTYISKMRIEVHSAGGNDEKKNQTLTEKRALAVANWLVTNGIDCQRLLPVGFGSTKPKVDPNTSAENNRVEFYNAELRGRAIGGMPLDGGGKAVEGFCQQ